MESEKIILNFKKIYKKYQIMSKSVEFFTHNIYFYKIDTYKKVLLPKLFLSIIILLIIIVKAKAEQRCYDYDLFNNGEVIETFGMDTTDNWWAVTKPYSDRYRMTVNDYSSKSYLNLSFPVFSPSGESWAFWGQDLNNIVLETNDTLITLDNYQFGEIVYSGNSEVLAYSYKVNEMTNFQIMNLNPNNLIIDKKLENIQNVNSKFYLDYSGKNFAYTTKNNEVFNVYLNELNLGTYDQVRIIGFWNDGGLYYIAKLGDYWKLYKNKTAVTDNFIKITEAKINLEGTFIAFVANELNGTMVVYSYYDDLSDFQTTRPYQNITNLNIHPYSTLYSFRATNANGELVVLSFTEFSITLNSNSPYFTYDGNEIFYIFCDNACFLGVNGLNYRLKNQFDIATQIAKKPNSKTFAFVTNANLVVYELETQEMYSGMMVDRLITPRYNRFQERYETIGIINNRLYLLTCKF